MSLDDLTSGSAGAGAPGHVHGDVRVQVLSPTLVRVEQRGPRGFEDRPTFTVTGRDWPGAPYDADGRRVTTTDWALVLPESGGVLGTELHAGGEVFHLDALPGPSWLPDPGSTGPVHAIADAPRLVPPPGGAVPSAEWGDLQDTSGYDTRNDAPDVYLFVTRDHAQLRQDVLRLTGAVPMVPRWVLGLWDSRYHPYSAADALEVVDAFRRRQVPLDVFVLDTDWRIGASKGYAVDTELLPDLPGLLRDLHDRGLRVVLNDHPEPQFDTALDPGETQFRYASLTGLLEQGVDAWWYDRNWSTRLHEPMPGLPPETWGASVFHDVAAAFRPDERPLVMSNVDGIDNGLRVHPPHPAFHRYPIAWTGDTLATWEYLRGAVDNLLHAGAVGLMPWVHEDAGAHVGAPSVELYVRFVQHCALSPVLRLHCGQGFVRHPWLLGAEAEQAAVEAIRFRYRLLPVLYAAAHEAARTGLPLARRLDLLWPDEPEALGYGQYLLGDDLLVSPVVAPRAPEFALVPGPFRQERFTGADLTGDVQEEDVAVLDWESETRVAFSVRWTGSMHAPRAGSYAVALDSRGSRLRLRLDGRVVVDEHTVLVDGRRTARVELAAGTHEVVVEHVVTHPRPFVRLLWDAGDPPVDTGQSWAHWVPPGDWHDPWTGEVVTGPSTRSVPVDLRTFPLLVRAGAVLLLGDDAVDTAAQQLERPVVAEVFPGPRTTRLLVEDDGVSLDGERCDWSLTSERLAGAVAVDIEGDGDRELLLRVHLAADEQVLQVERDGVVVDHEVEQPTGVPARGLPDVLAARGGPVMVLPVSGPCGVQVRLV